MQEFGSVRYMNGSIVLGKAEGMAKVTLDGTEYSLIYLEALKPVSHSITLKKIELSSKCDKTEPEFVVANDIDVDVDAFMPFGETISMFSECYIGHDRIFSQQGAAVELSFSLAVREKLASLNTGQETEDLRVIKRKSEPVRQTLAHTSP